MSTCAATDFFSDSWMDVFEKVLGVFETENVSTYIAARINK